MPSKNERPDGNDGPSKEVAKQRVRLPIQCDESNTDCVARFGSLRLTRVTKPKGGVRRRHRQRRNWMREWKKQTLDELGNQLHGIDATELFSMMMDYNHESTDGPHTIAATEPDTETLDKPESTPSAADSSQTLNNAVSTEPTEKGGSCPEQSDRGGGELSL